MCVGVEAYNNAVTLASLTVIPDALSAIAIRYLPPNELPPLSCRGIFISAISISYLLYKGELISIPACLYGIALQGVSIYNLAKKIMPDILIISNEMEMREKLKSLNEGMEQMNLRNIGVKSFRQRYKRQLERFNNLTPETAVEILQNIRTLHREFWQFYADRLYLNRPAIEG